MGFFDRFQKTDHVKTDLTSHTLESTEGNSVRGLPFLSISDILIFPGSTVPLYILKPAGQKSVDLAMSRDRKIIIGYPKSGQETITFETLESLATEAKLIQVMKLPNNTSRIIVEGLSRVKITNLDIRESLLTAEFSRLEESQLLDSEPVEQQLYLIRALKDEFDLYSKSNKKITKDTLVQVQSRETPNQLVDLILSNLTSPSHEKLLIFLDTRTLSRMQSTLELIKTEREILELRKNVAEKVKKKMEDSQKEYYINEQIKEMQKELGKDADDPSGLKELEDLYKTRYLPPEAKEKFTSELKRLKRLQGMSPEAGIIRGYLEWLLDLPWPKPIDQSVSEIELNLSSQANTESSSEPSNSSPLESPSLDQAEQILNSQHFGMEEAKERILDFIAVKHLKPDLKAPILCFVGPPGTGKTSLGQSLAKAMGRNFVRVSLGGVRDEAEIRGHRRTYVGAMPGKIIQGMKKAKSISPVFLLDEIDKLGSDHRGDPSSALLEVLDPEQNNTFVDHYIEIPYDISHVVFITTANSLHSIPGPLRDRMEIIPIPSYTEHEKAIIAKEFLIPKLLSNHGLDGSDFKISQEAMSSIINEYTMEAGVRSLERVLSKTVRKAARKKAELLELDKKVRPFTVSKNNLVTLLGNKKMSRDYTYDTLTPGLANGLAWTETGGKILQVETAFFPGKSNLILTGSLGDVMKESARISLTLAKQMAKEMGFQNFDFPSFDYHIHVPEGAIPKDGPSAGITLTVSLFSSLLGKPVPQGFAMTGEITLTGRILPVGGIKEKVLAAHRNSLHCLILPKENATDWEELSKDVQKDMTVTFVSHIQDALPVLGLSVSN
jgi:ATP-dependent Lon protease